VFDGHAAHFESLSNPSPARQLSFGMHCVSSTVVTEPIPATNLSVSLLQSAADCLEVQVLAATISRVLYVPASHAVHDESSQYMPAEHARAVRRFRLVVQVDALLGLATLLPAGMVYLEYAAPPTALSQKQALSIFSVAA
jgi:hypothetical protein